MPRSRKRSFVAQVGTKFLTQIGQYVGIIEFAVILVHFGYFGFQFFLITFGQAAHHEQFVCFVFLFAIGKLQNGVDAFFFCIANKSAGVDNYNFTIGFFSIMADFISQRIKLTHK